MSDKINILAEDQNDRINRQTDRMTKLLADGITPPTEMTTPDQASGGTYPTGTGIRISFVSLLSGATCSASESSLLDSATVIYLDCIDNYKHQVSTRVILLPGTR